MVRETVIIVFRFSWGVSHVMVLRDYSPLVLRWTSLPALMLWDSCVAGESDPGFLHAKPLLCIELSFPTRIL